MRIIYCIFIISFLNLSSFSQKLSHNNCNSCATLKGKVVDYFTKETIVGANIILLNTTNGVTSDIEGNFTIHNLIPDKYILRCSIINYTPSIDTIQLYANETKTITIEMLDEKETLANQAYIDIRNGKLKIYLGGWPIFGAPLDEINKIAEKHGFQYVFDGGCDPYAFHWDKYNEIIMNYLDKIQGKEWRENIQEEKEELYKKFNK